MSLDVYTRVMAPYEVPAERVPGPAHAASGGGNETLSDPIQVRVIRSGSRA